MWSFFGVLVNQILGNGLLLSYMDQVFVCFINFINKDPVNFKTGVLAGQQSTCFDSMCAIVAKAFHIASECERDTESLAAITLVNAMLENVPDISPTLPGLLDLYLNEL